MSLRVWLPLNGSLINQGLDNITVTNNGATVDNSGKIGKCYSFSGSNYITVQEVNLPNTWSYCCWLYSEVSSRSWEVVMTCNNNGGDADMQLGLYTRPSGNNIQNTANGQYNASIPMTYGQWNHFVGTFDGSNLKTYLNGILVNTKAITNTKLDRPKLTIGARCRGSNYDCYFKGKLNDIRIYDHALSDQEVKKISQGLILHYPLDRNGWGNENLITQSMIDADPWKSAIRGTYTIDGKTGWILANNILYSKSGNGTNNIFYGLTYDDNTQYTISFKWRDDYRTDNKSSSLYIRFKYSDNTYSQVISSANYNYWKEEIMTSTAGKTVSAITTTYGNGGNLLFTDLKLEKGNVKTPFSPITNSSLTTLIGMNTNVVKDISGYQNNGTINGTLSYSTNTPKHLISSSFNGSDNAIQTPDLKNMITDKTYTISCWTYKTVIGTKGYQTIYGGPSGFELEARSGSTTTPLFRIHNWGGGTTAYEFDNWYHFCFVHNDENSKLYINGELKLTGSSISIPSGNYFIGAWKTATQQNYDGLISDFRIYCTALSADEVKDLYKDNMTD